MNRKRPWNQIDQPVYSISSRGVTGDQNMNIITYVTAISLYPKKFACCVYENTKTLDNVVSNNSFVLQLLRDDQYNLISLLGRKSGYSIDKISILAKRKKITEWNGFKILNDCLAIIQMKVVNQIISGDHSVFLCDVVAYKNISSGKPLTLNLLRNKKLIRI